MKITELTIRSFKGIETLKEIGFDSHINLFVGQNDSGKSSVLEAIERLFSKKTYSEAKWIPHISPNDLSGKTKPNAAAKVEFDLLIELIDEAPVTVYVPKHIHDTRIKKHLTDNSTFTLATGGENSSSFFSQPQQDDRVVEIKLTSAGMVTGKADQGSNPTISKILKRKALSKFFYFSSQRYNAGECASSANIQLDGNANNFPNCLENLRATPEKFKNYLGLVKRVLPNITDIVTVTKQTDRLLTRVLVYKTTAIDERLGIPLNDCGTGVSQILVMLYVLSQQESGIILIDEPGSFLNPSAEKALVKIIKEFTNFQFILATHSAPLISGSLPCKVYQCHWNVGLGKTEVEEIDIGTLEGQKNIMYDLGISFTDVFGTSAILWVEGPTEKGVFELLLP